MANMYYKIKKLWKKEISESKERKKKRKKSTQNCNHKEKEIKINSLGVLTVNSIYIPQTQSLRFYHLWEAKIKTL